MFSYMTKHLILKAYMYRGGSKTFNVDILEAEYLPWTEPESPVVSVHDDTDFPHESVLFKCAAA